tara:strand:- start:672 stop:1106 length:435 start_codon:yes stop_codon:yes gene_type:complete
MNEQTIFLPVSLRLIQWNKETVENGKVVQTPKQCYAHTTSQGRVMQVNGNDLNTTTTCKVNGVDMSQSSTGIDYAKWYWDMTVDMFNSLQQLGLGTCYMAITFNGTLANITNEELVSVADYDSLMQSQPDSIVNGDTYLQQLQA